ncbi:IclR family transcriptional regulator [Deinococcus ruber]|uniref:Transcriptional regulator n=1 Tax=Deinococcus ruber TaxID=1848197 RepID=A0A918CL63_9DEIO|nr:IclR family transcriptional regulator [Deinococcus ruber]GGR28845.1 transcriptional regulator [Deinococcus ruber]
MTPPARRPGRKSSGDTAAVRTLERGLHLLRILGEHHGLTLSDVARRADLSPSTTYRLLQTLRAQGFAHLQEDAGLWQVGVQAFVTGSAYQGRGSVTLAARSIMDELVSETGETINLSVLQEGEVMYIHQAEGRGLMRAFTHIGARAPLHCTGAGKVLTAWQDAAEMRSVLGPGPYHAYTPHTLTTVSALTEHLAQVRQQGYALDDEERELGVRCVALPVRGPGGQVVAALSLSAPSARLPAAQVPPLATLLQRASERISARLG